MSKTFMGHLAESDPLFQYFRHDIQPQLGGDVNHLRYRVYRLTGSNDVYLYEEKYSGTRIIGKFFLSEHERNAEVATRRMNREFDNLTMMRSYGFTGYPHYIARPLGRNEALNRLLVVEYCGGELLSSVITRAISTGNDTILYDKLKALAYFLATFHNRTVTDWGVDFNASCAYMSNLSNQLKTHHVIGDRTLGKLHDLEWRWHDQGKMWSDCQVWLHGDATPENFLFGGDLGVISFDLERLQRGDRIFDTGRIAGELQHFFMLNTGNKYAAEPFIGHFLWEYACHFPDRDRTFQETCRRVPFYMGTTLLRIARNDYLDWGYRQRLVHEALLCLRRWSL